MLDSLWRRLHPHRSSSQRDQVIGLVLLILTVLSVVPFFDCPCGGGEGSPRIRVVAAPSDDVAYLAMTSCRACRDTGRRSMFDRWFNDAPILPPAPPSP